MEGLSLASALGLTLDFLLYLIKLIKLAMEIYETGKVADNERLQKEIDVLTVMVKCLQERALTDDDPLTDEERTLHDLCSDCNAASNQLQTMIDNLQEAGGKGRLFCKNVWKSRAKGKLEVRFNQCGGQLTSFVTTTKSTRIQQGLDDIKRSNELYAARLESLTKEVSTLGSEMARHIHDLGLLLGIGNQIQQGVQGIGTRMDREGAEKRATSILDRLAFDGMHTRYENLADAEANSFRWLIDADIPLDDSPLQFQAREAFLTWLREGKGIFHMTGKPGAGKSTLMKFLSDNVHGRLQAWSSPKTVLLGKYFIFKPNAQSERAMHDFYRGLLHSLLDHAYELIPIIFPQEWKDNPKHSEHKLDPSHIKSALDTLRTLDDIYINYRLVIFIDGIDEFMGCQKDLCLLLKEWAQLRPHGVKICVSSREDLDIHETLEPSATLRLQDVTFPDILAVVHDRLTKITNYATSDTPGWRANLERYIAERSEGVFLWAGLVPQRLADKVKDGYMARDLVDAVDSLPQSLDRLFQEILASMRNMQTTWPFALLQMVLLCRRPWPLSRVLFLFKYLEDPYFTRSCTLSSTGNNPDDLRARLIHTKDMINRHCHGLLEIHTNQPGMTLVVTFTHRSAFEFLSQNADLVASCAAFPKGHDAFDALCQTMLADLCAKVTPFCQENLPRADLRVSYLDGFVTIDPIPRQSSIDFQLDLIDIWELMKMFVRQKVPPQRPERFFWFLASVARILGAAQPEEYDLNLWLEFELFGKPRAPPPLLSSENSTRWTSDHDPCQPVRLMFPFLFPVLTACIGIPWRESNLIPLLPAGEDYASWLTRIVPFSALTLNAIGSAQRQLPRAAAGFIELLELYWRQGLSLDQQSGDEVIAGAARDQSRWEFFLVEALGMGSAWHEKQRLLPLFALFLWHGGDPQVELEVQLDDQAYKQARALKAAQSGLGFLSGMVSYHDPLVPVDDGLPGGLLEDCPDRLPDDPSNGLFGGLSGDPPGSRSNSLFGGPSDGCSNGLFGGPSNGCSNSLFGSLPGGQPEGSSYSLFGAPPDGPSNGLFGGLHGDPPDGPLDGPSDGPFGGFPDGPPHGPSDSLFSGYPWEGANDFLSSLTLTVGKRKKKIELVYSVKDFPQARALKPLRDRMGNAFTLRDLVTALFPAKAAATLHKLVDSPLADLSPEERASRMHELEAEVQALWCLEAIEDAFGD